MIIFVAGKQIRGDLILQAVLRSDLAPIPLTFEGSFRIDGDLSLSLNEGDEIEVAGNKMIIVKTERVSGKHQQGGRIMDAVKVTAFLKGVESLSYLRKIPVIKENKPLSECLKACGCTLPVNGDFPVPRFSVFTGMIPTYQVSMILQEEGRVMNWCARTKKLVITRLLDFSGKAPIDGVMITGQKVDTSEFLERHSVPMFYSVDDSANLIMGDAGKDRNSKFTPRKSKDQLFNMTRSLIATHDGKISYSGSIQAGDVVQLTTGDKRVVMTAVHVFKNGSDGKSEQEQYSRLWLGEVKS